MVPHPVAPDQEPAYQGLIQHAQNGVLQFDKMMTILLARNPQWQANERTSTAFTSVSITSVGIPLPLY